MAIIAYAATNRSAHRTLFGYGVFDVLTDSMQSEIPQGSYVLTHRTNPAKISNGNVVTYLADKNTTITHEVIAVYPDYEGSGQYAFKTKGIENPVADPKMVYGSNIVGVVKAHVYFGGLPAWIRSHGILDALFAGAILCALAAFILLRAPAKKKSAEVT